MDTVTFTENGIALIRSQAKDVVHRTSRNPGDDISDLPDDPRSYVDKAGETVDLPGLRTEIANYWTPEVVAAFEAEVAAREAAEPTPPTQDEIDEAQTAQIERQGTIIKALATAIYTLANDVRALEGKNSITPTQFRNYIKGLLR